MNPETDDRLWQRISAALFGVRRTTDERIFTASVMADIRKLQPADASWRMFARWALPALALSMGGFGIALLDSLQPDTVSAETLLLGDQEPAALEEWVSTAPINVEPVLEKGVQP